MSRSRKRTPGWTDYRLSLRVAKRAASKAVRRCPAIPDGGKYKTLYCSYDLRDWRCLFYTSQAYQVWCEKWGEPPHRGTMK